MASNITSTSNTTSETVAGSNGADILYYFTTKAYMFKTVEEVPEYVNKATPFFLGLIALEFVIAVMKGLPRVRINDGMSSLAGGVMIQLLKLVVFDFEIGVYILIYENYRLTTLPWDSAWTWWLCFFAVEFMYYIMHRATHEVNILWAAHQAHHSSEDYNLTTALRQSLTQNVLGHVFYLPIALAVPPSVCIVHFQFNLLYQFWIHTEVISSLGPLEYIFNTPSHHRVHHGRNPYCIDKNYGAILIIWDRLFGTFQPETDEKISYGLVHPLNSWNPIWAQFQHFVHIFKTSWNMPGLWNKVSVFLKGPGWSPGKPRLGDPAEIPQIEGPITKYDRTILWWQNIYVVFHFAFTFLLYDELFRNHLTMSQLHVALVALFFITTITVFGCLMDGKSYGPLLEFFRCVFCVAVEVAATNNGVKIEVVPSFLPNMFLRILYLGSAYIWFVETLIDRKETSKLD